MFKIINRLKERIEIIKILYLQENVSLENEEVSPLLVSNLSGLPKTLVVTSEYDFLRIQGEDYVKGLIEAGVDAKNVRYNGMDHAVLDKCGYYPQAEDCINEIVKDIKLEFIL